MIEPSQLREYVIRPVLKRLALHSRSAEELLMLTAAQESLLGRFLHQVNGPALGIFQMEPATHDDIWGNYLDYRQGLADSVRDYGWAANHMVGNLNYACAMARIHYLRVPYALPQADDVQGMAEYWKRHYNTPQGHGTVKRAVDNYTRLVIQGSDS